MESDFCLPPIFTPLEGLLLSKGGFKFFPHRVGHIFCPVTACEERAKSRDRAGFKGLTNTYVVWKKKKDLVYILCKFRVIGIYFEFKRLD